MEKKAYQAPEMTTVTFQVEEGFAISNLSLFNPDFTPINYDNNRRVEDYSSANNWQQGSNHFWD